MNWKDLLRIGFIILVVGLIVTAMLSFLITRLNTEEGSDIKRMINDRQRQGEQIQKILKDDERWRNEIRAKDEQFHSAAMKDRLQARQMYKEKIDELTRKIDQILENQKKESR